MVTNPAEQARRRKRLRVVEELLLNGYGPSEIHDLIGEQYSVAPGTIRNDIVAVNKAHRADITSATELEGREKYLASIRVIRRKALSGWNETDAQGVVKVRGRDFKLAHQLDQEIARISGVNLKVDDRTIKINMEKARGYLDLIFQIVFKHVEDEDTRKLILDEVDLIEDE